MLFGVCLGNEADMFASINDLGSIAIYSLLAFTVRAMLGMPVPFGMFPCHIVVIVACIVAGN
jgi:hypothetical protein